MTQDIRTVSLFDVDDAESFSAIRDLTIGKASQSDVHEFCRRWHYSNTGGNMSWNYGLWDGFVLVGVVSYNLPTMDTCEGFFGAEHWQWVAHMGRLVCAQELPRNAESHLIAGSLKALKRDVPAFRAVVTYASIGAGHIGYVYQATNALYTGRTSPRSYYEDQSGQMRSTKQGQYVSHASALERGWSIKTDPGKHRYLYLLGNKTERREALRLLKFPTLPYPKES